MISRLTSPGVIPVQFPIKLGCLFERHRYKLIDSGRGAAKSWSVADALLMLGKDATLNEWRCSPTPLRIVCARETMKSLKDSSYKLLGDRVKDLGLGSQYEFQQALVKGRNGTEFMFTGLSDPDSIKSLEGADILWIEEAQGVSKRSWDTVVPTLRKEGVDAKGDWYSEVWATWNPLLDTDETYIRAKVHPRTGTKTVTLSWRDNPWFPKILDIDRLDCKRLDPAGYRNIWEGETRSSVEGAIYALELQAALDGKRIGQVARDRTKPVDTYWDLGYGDKTAIWFGQAVDGWYRLVDYLEDDGRTIEWYLIQLQNKGYLYGTDWLPHDSVDTIIHKNLAGGDKSRSIEMLMRAAGRNVRIAPKLHVPDRINAGRTIFPQCQFDQDACADGLSALRRYQWGPVGIKRDPKTGMVHEITAREPLHNDASHGADAFQCFAVCAKQPVNPPPPKAPRPRAVSAWA